MDLALSEQQQDLVRFVGGFLAKECPSERVRASEPLGFDAELWRQFVDMGLGTMGVPEALGGGGASIEDLALVMLEAGKRIPPVPLVETVVANNLLGRLAALTSASPAVGGLLEE